MKSELPRFGAVVVIAVLCGAALVACSRPPKWGGVLVYADGAGRILGRDLASGNTRTLASDGADGDLAVDRNGMRVVYSATGPDGSRGFVIRNVVTNVAEPLCQSGYPGVPVHWRGGAFSAGGDEVVFATFDAAGERSSHLAKGLRHCARIASGIGSADFGPGIDRVLLADDHAVAAYHVADTLSPRVPAGVSLPPIWRSDEKIVDLAVDRLYERFAVLTQTRIVVRGFSGAASYSFEFNSLDEGDASLRPAAAAFAPDGERVAIVFGSRERSVIHVLDVSKGGGEIVDRGPLALDPPPIPAQVAWVPRLLGAGESQAP